VAGEGTAVAVSGVIFSVVFNSGISELS